MSRAYTCSGPLENSSPYGEQGMAQRISVNDVRQRLGQHDGMLFVCAYDDDQRWKDAGVTGSIPFSQLQSKVNMLPKTQEITFFCG